MFSKHNKETIPMPKRGPNRIREAQDRERREEAAQAEKVKESVNAQAALNRVKAAGEAARVAQERREQGVRPVVRQARPQGGAAPKASEGQNARQGRQPVVGATGQGPASASAASAAPTASTASPDENPSRIFNSAHRQHADSHQSAVAMFAQGSKDGVDGASAGKGGSSAQNGAAGANGTPEDRARAQAERIKASVHAQMAATSHALDQAHAVAAAQNAGAVAHNGQARPTSATKTSAASNSQPSGHSVSPQNASKPLVQGPSDAGARGKGLASEGIESQATDAEGAKPKAHSGPAASPNSAPSNAPSATVQPENAHADASASNGSAKADDNGGAKPRHATSRRPDSLASSAHHAISDPTAPVLRAIPSNGEDDTDAHGATAMPAADVVPEHIGAHHATGVRLGRATRFGEGFPDDSMVANVPFDRDVLPTSGASEPDVLSTTKFVDAFFAELARCGVEEAVVSEGERSEFLSVKAIEHFGDVHSNIDARSAAFYALGLAKATANPVVVVGDGGAASANWLPAMVEARADRVPLIFVSASLPASEGAGDASTCATVLDAAAKHVIHMPVLPARDVSEDLARQKALEACVRAHGLVPGARACAGGPVQVVFQARRTTAVGMRTAEEPESSLPPTVVAGQGFAPRNARGLFSILRRSRAVAVCGEGTCSSPEDVEVLVEFAHRCNVPLLADALSGLRGVDDPMVIDAYDAVLTSSDVATPDVVVQMGQRPVSAEACRRLRTTKAFRIVVGMSSSTVGTSREIYVRSTPVVFAETMSQVKAKEAANEAYAKAWQDANRDQRMAMHEIRERDDLDDLEIGYVDALAKMVPDGTTLFCGPGAPMRMLDAVLERGEHTVDVMSNHGTDAPTGVLSTALGAAQTSEHTTVLLTANQLSCDMGAPSLQLDMAARANRDKTALPSVVVVCLDRDGRSDSLPSAPTSDSVRLRQPATCVDLKHVCKGMGATYRHVSNNHELRRVYPVFAHEPGLHVIDVRLPKTPAIL